MENYRNFFHPSELEKVELHYVDQIEVPIPTDRDFRLEDYFRLHVVSPPEFGPTSYFSTRLFLLTPTVGDILEVEFESEPPTPDAQSYRFRIDWHMVCSGVKVFDPDVVGARLDQAHDYLTRYFRSSVTDQTWALFQPTDEG